MINASMLDTAAPALHFHVRYFVLLLDPCHAAKAADMELVEATYTTSRGGARLAAIQHSGND